MKRGELCESCGSFNEGSYSVGICPLCEKDVCNKCGNLQICPECFTKHYNAESGIVTLGGTKFKYIISQGEEIGEWKKI